MQYDWHHFMKQEFGHRNGHSAYIHRTVALRWADWRCSWGPVITKTAVHAGSKTETHRDSTQSWRRSSPMSTVVLSTHGTLRWQPFFFEVSRFAMFGYSSPRELVERMCAFAWGNENALELEIEPSCWDCIKCHLLFRSKWQNRM